MNPTKVKMHTLIAANKQIVNLFIKYLCLDCVLLDQPMITAIDRITKRKNAVATSVSSGNVQPIMSRYFLDFLCIKQ